MRRIIASKPPDRDGVGASAIATTAGGWATFLDFLAWKFPAIDHDHWLARINGAQVVDEQGVTIQGDPTTVIRCNCSRNPSRLLIR